MMKNKVYLFLYNPCIWESSFCTISIHKTKLGAYRAMREHKLKCYEEYKKIENRFKNNKFFAHKFGEDECWTIKSQEILN